MVIFCHEDVERYIFELELGQLWPSSDLLFFRTLAKTNKDSDNCTTVLNADQLNSNFIVSQTIKLYVRLKFSQDCTPARGTDNII